MKYFLLFLGGAIASASFADTKIDLSSQMNVDMQQYLFGNNFPLGGSTINVAGVDFNIGKLGGDPATTGAIERSDKSDITATFSGLNIQINNPTSLYTLVDEQFGRDGSYLGYITVRGSKGESSTLQLVSGANVGNNWTAGGMQTLTDSSVQHVYVKGGQIVNTVDINTMAYYRQELALSGSFIGDSVTSITYYGFNNGDPNLGVGVFAAATFGQTGVCVCPEPASMAAIGLGIVALLRRKRN